jgi:hypothetical protein
LQCPERKADLDDATIQIVKKMLAMPPRHHDEMKVGLPKEKKQRNPKDRAASAKRHTVSRTESE